MVAYLVQYGKSAYLGRFTPGEGPTYVRGERVVIDGPRGREIGTVLCEAQARFAHEAADGEVLRASEAHDEAAMEANEEQALEMLAFARQRAEADALPFEAIDVEVALDRRTAILHGLAWSDCDASPLLEELSNRFNVIVRFLDLARTAVVAEPASGCGKEGCGSKGGCDSCGTGGCSTGGCSRGKVKSADELTNYFASLRRQMEETPRRVPLA